MLGIGLFVTLLVRERRYATGAALLLIGLRAPPEGRGAAMLLFRPDAFVTWISPGVLLGVAMGALLLVPASLLPRPARSRYVQSRCCRRCSCRCSHPT